MFCGTLRENVDPMRRYSDFSVQEAINQAGLVGKTLDTDVGVGGEGWSIGERQLVCLDVRAIVRCDCVSVLQACHSFHRFV
jgi:ABC-type multidrug transport system fused ATPase/permease subunit